jgi:hypothetical protein
MIELDMINFGGCLVCSECAQLYLRRCTVTGLVKLCATCRMSAILATGSGHVPRGTKDKAGNMEICSSCPSVIKCMTVRV